MSEIPSDWSLVALLLFGAMFTALTAGAAIFLAESWFQTLRQRREHFKIWQEQQLKSSRRLDRIAKRLNQK